MDLEDAHRHIAYRVERAIDHITTEYEPDWALAEKYYNGETDLPIFPGASQVVKTEVRDAVRNTLPSIFRVLLQARKIVDYHPNHPLSGAWVEQQAEYVTQLFWRSDGYTQLFNAVDEATRRRYSPIKAYFEPHPDPEYIEYTNVPFTIIEEMMADPAYTDIEYEDAEEDPQLGEMYNVYALKEHKKGRIRLEAVPTYEFFIDENSTTIREAEETGVHGHYRSLTVAEAEAMGLECDDWDAVDNEDPEITYHGGSSKHSRGYAKNEKDTEVDPQNKMVRITEAYAKMDLEGTGTRQLYCFWYAGTSYKYLDHERVEESPFELAKLNLKAHSLCGHSIADLTIKEQDASTSMLRAAVDNAHRANNPRYAGDPSRTNFDDLTSTTNAPIRTREQLQVTGVPFTGQGLMSILQYMDLDTQSKVGVTKAAQGLDPDALQSTDKNAVINTIQTSQGQVELMVRNLVETCLIPLFRKMLKLATRHFDHNQVMKTKGVVIPLSLKNFDPDLIATPNVGLGTASPLQKRQALMFIMQKQEQYMQTMGPDNPFTSYAKMYNAMEDLLEIEGIYDTGRYFSLVTPEIEKKIAERQAMAAQEAQKDKPADPAKALLAAEAQKNRTKLYELEVKKQTEAGQLSLESFKAASDADLKRDELVQKRELELIKLDKQDQADKIRNEQDATQSPTPPRNSKASSG